MSKKVDLPAPLGPMRARISPRSRANDTPSTARTPPNARRTFSTSRTGARSATLARPQHAEDPARKHKHQGHEDDAEHELPVFRVTRDHGVEQLVERGDERRAWSRAARSVSPNGARPIAASAARPAPHAARAR